MKKLLYFGYYLKQTEREKFFRFLQFAKEDSRRCKLILIFDMLVSTFKYNVSFLDYFYFRFYKKSPQERLLWAGSGYMYEYHLVMNPRGSRSILENKIKFLQNYDEFVHRNFASINTLKKEPAKALELLKNPSGKVVLKLSTGQVGAEVKVFDSEEFTAESLVNQMDKSGFDLAEEFVVQHSSLMALSPSGLNTVRIFTQLDGAKVVFLGARLRISVNSQVDNMGAGNLAAPVDIETGEINGPAVYSDITKQEEKVHPVTNQPIIGFTVPHWNEVLEMIRKASLLHPENKSIGWDIAVTEKGPELIEGNHNWCRLLWQLPVKQGLKNRIDEFWKNQ